MSWELPPLHRHLSTIGIGPVFIRPPPHTLPSNPIECSDGADPKKKKEGDDGDDDANITRTAFPPCHPSNNQIKKNEEDVTTTTWEIVGDIKSTPEDFIVREIGWAPPSSASHFSVEQVEHSSDVKNGNINSKPGEHSNTKNNDVKHNTKKYRKRPGWSRRIAGLEYEKEATASSAKSFTKNDNDIQSSEKEVAEDEDVKVHQPTVAIESISTTDTSTSDKSLGSIDIVPATPQLTTRDESKFTVPSSNGSDEKEWEAAVDPSPIEGLRRVLTLCLHDNQKANGDTTETHTLQSMSTSADSILKQLADLQHLVLDKIDQKYSTNSDTSGDTIGGEKVWIPTAKLFQSGTSPNTNSKENWTLLHRHLRQAFPLLRTESSSLGPDNSDCSEKSDDCDASDPNEKGENNGINDNINNDASKAWVSALVDCTFFPIAPYLSNPREDLLLLYKFRNFGPTPALGKEGDRNRSRSKYRKWPKKNEPIKEEQSGKKLVDTVPKANQRSNQGRILLRLRTDLPRSERRTIHQILASSRRREFDTSTEKDVPLDYADENSKMTSAIAVQWSFNAIKTSQKKRKRSVQVGDGNNPRKELRTEKSSDITAIFCVLRKHQCEHQVAIQNVVRALRCRAGDVGLAGIKDMQAITYQFCTLRNVDSKMARRANNFLGTCVRLSSFVEVRDVLLDRGQLLGNRFEIIIRKLKRVERMHMEGEESWKERMVPVRASHVDAMVKRIADGGFINFYGEQRVGDAGSRNHVGVRSFDVGRAMLQLDFRLAIDLIMAGRSARVYNPGVEETNAREVWKTSGGDARATLKAFPKNRNTMVRERDLVKGWLRYGDALEAIRCLPHNIRMFWIHSYQSYIWNKIATERVKRWGLRPVKGDLYIRENDGDIDAEDGTTVDVQVVTDPDSVSISQIILPLPGYNIQYPPNDVGELYTKMLHDDGIEMSKNNKIPESTAKGSYRKLFQRATNLKWDIVGGKENKDQLDSTADQMVSAARLTFELESGCYATMMLRELMLSTMSRGCKVKQKTMST